LKGVYMPMIVVAYIYIYVYIYISIGIHAPKGIHRQDFVTGIRC
jgi:hypothetical protein